MAVRDHVGDTLASLQDHLGRITRTDTPGLYLFQDILDDIEIERRWVGEHRRDPGWTRDFLFEYRHHLTVLETQLFAMIVQSGVKRADRSKLVSNQYQQILPMLKATIHLRRFLSHLDSPPDPT